MKENFYQGKYAVITGASSGIGKEIAEQLAHKGMNLILVARRIDRLEMLKEKLESEADITVVIKSLDLSVQDNCHRLFSETKTFAPAIVVNNAGFGQVGFFENLPLEKELEMLRLNIESLHILTKLYLSEMEQGVIVNVASMAGFLPTPLMAAYSASKAYVLNFTRAVNQELKIKQRKVRVVALCPGPVETEFADVANASQSFKGMSAKRCAKITIRGIENKRTVIIPGLLMKITHVLVKLVPTKIILYFAYLIQRRK